MSWVKSGAQRLFSHYSVFSQHLSPLSHTSHLHCIQKQRKLELNLIEVRYTTQSFYSLLVGLLICWQNTFLEENSSFSSLLYSIYYSYNWRLNGFLNSQNNCVVQKQVRLLLPAFHFWWIILGVDCDIIKIKMRNETLSPLDLRHREHFQNPGWHILLYRIHQAQSHTSTWLTDSSTPFNALNARLFPEQHKWMLLLEC